MSTSVNRGFFCWLIRIRTLILRSLSPPSCGLSLLRSAVRPVHHNQSRVSNLSGTKVITLGLCNRRENRTHSKGRLLYQSHKVITPCFTCRATLCGHSTLPNVSKDIPIPLSSQLCGFSIDLPANVDEHLPQTKARWSIQESNLRLGITPVVPLY